MGLYVIGDLHLSFSTNKPMDIFGEQWGNHAAKIKEKWVPCHNDTVVLLGDTSWAMNFKELEDDFSFLDTLPGKKIIVKGNHDYWWNSAQKLTEYAKGHKDIFFLHNNTFETEKYFICGTRGWFLEPGAIHDEKIIAREVGRLKMSLDAYKRTCSKKEAIVFLHYPPLYANVRSDEIMKTLEEYNIKRCFYAHLHGRQAHVHSKNGMFDGIDMQLVSADYLNFNTYQIL